MKELINKKQAVVLFSGGQDSTTCLLEAMEHYDKVYPLSFNYGQKHKVELRQAKRIIQKLGLQENWKTLNIQTLKQIGDSALIGKNKDVNEIKDNLPASFVPGRNIILLSYAAAYAYKLGIPNIITGVNQLDYSGYPDCRKETIVALQESLRLGMEADFIIHIPLIDMTKADIWGMVINDKTKFSIIKNLSHTCYNGVRKSGNPWGKGCGTCPACILRAKGLEDALGPWTPEQVQSLKEKIDTCENE